MKPTLQPEFYGFTELDDSTMANTDGGSEIGYMVGQAIGWGIKFLKALADGASESAQSMPGLK